MSRLLTNDSNTIMDNSNTIIVKSKTIANDSNTIMRKSMAIIVGYSDVNLYIKESECELTPLTFLTPLTINNQHIYPNPKT